MTTTTKRCRLSWLRPSFGRRSARVERWNMCQRLAILAIAATFTGCSSQRAVQCEVSSNCNLTSGGVCAASPSGMQWCAYGDPNCPSGLRYASDDVGEGLDGVCVAGGTSVGVQCAQDENCTMSSGGRCITAATGNRWCAYADAACPSGLRFSNNDVADSLGGTCTKAFALSLSVGGSAPGAIASTPQSFTCASGTCKTSFAAGTQLELAASSYTVPGTGENTLVFRSITAPLDLHLTASSPASVVNAAGACTGKDVDGDVRPVGTACDLGADERNP